MNQRDIIYSAICGLAVSWIAADFFNNYALIFLFILPLMAVAGLWLFDLIGTKVPFVRQVGKFSLAGAFADVIDIKVFQLLFLFLPVPLFIKFISSIVAILIKYWINKFWAFEKNGITGLNKEMIKFFIITIGGLLLNICVFYFFTQIIGPQFSLSTYLWVELSIILSALGAAIWNFLGYKFIVFKK